MVTLPETTKKKKGKNRTSSRLKKETKQNQQRQTEAISVIIHRLIDPVHSVLLSKPERDRARWWLQVKSCKKLKKGSNGFVA